MSCGIHITRCCCLSQLHIMYNINVYIVVIHTHTHARVNRTFLASTNVEFKETSSLLQLPTAVGQFEGHSTTLQQSLSLSFCLSFSPLCAQRACALLSLQLCNVTDEPLISSRCYDSVVVHLCGSLALSLTACLCLFNDVSKLQGQHSTDCTIRNRFSLPVPSCF